MDDVLRAGANCGSELSCLIRQNIHWRPQYAGCPYCHVDYQIIGKAETFADDVKYIVLKKNLTSLIPLEATKKKNHATNQEAKKTNYMAQLSKDQIERLYRYYQRDFDLFGYHYDIAEYIH